MRGMAATSRLSRVLAALCLVVSASLVAYPYVSNYIQRTAQLGVVQAHNEAVDGESASSLAAQREQALDYNRRLAAGRTVVTDPFDPANQPVTDEEYEQILNQTGDGVMGDIVIPKLGVTVPIYHGTGDEALAHGAGHLQATSLPVGGESSHCVVAGHNGLPQVRIFDDLHKLKKGDYFVIQVLGEDHAYRVTGTQTVLPDETDSLVIQPGKDLVTLITCTPYGVNTHRLLVHAERCELPDEWLERDKAASSRVNFEPTQALVPLTLAGTAIGLGAVIGRLILKRQTAKTRGAHFSAYPKSRRKR